jgi:hypothetical protein
MCIHLHPIILGSVIQGGVPFLVLWCPNCGCYTYAKSPLGPYSGKWVGSTDFTKSSENSAVSTWRRALRNAVTMLENILADEMAEGRPNSLAAQNARQASKDGLELLNSR